ncbi:hypothetical protein SAMN04487970_101687 [Paenibacillus tianmuensis]|uniref:Uncharacterized protein n=1 Tax=Paenibacillus tianmuensis TaxID=624147 RepID=A0A1G4RLE5_9BACL|nr:hypothetical protein [Paenibacillus tianmuensis]SCW57335.1 hypothetical protein SAMN04487970_101687 [Paenibacillus tianmuensis]
MSVSLEKYEHLLFEENDLVYKIRTYQQVIAAIMMLVHERGTNDLHLLTIEEIITDMHSAELIHQSELLHLRLAKSVLSNSITRKLKTTNQ